MPVIIAHFINHLSFCAEAYWYSFAQQARLCVFIFWWFSGLIDLDLIVIPGFAIAQSAFLSLKGPCWTIHPEVCPSGQSSLLWSHLQASRRLTVLSLHLAWQLVSSLSSWFLGWHSTRCLLYNLLFIILIMPFNLCLVCQYSPFIGCEGSYLLCLVDDLSLL